MFKLATGFAALAVVLQLVAGQSQEWGQCGGIGWAGPTTCGKLTFQYSVLYADVITEDVAHSCWHRLHEVE